MMSFVIKERKRWAHEQASRPVDAMRPPTRQGKLSGERGVIELWLGDVDSFEAALTRIAT